MSVIIRKAERRGARVVIAFAGVSGSGKTYSGLQFAYGLAGYQAGKVGLLDTENRRGSLYADILQRATKPTGERFQIGDLAAPFSPQRYIDAIKQFQEAGVEVLVIDSCTHEWEGVGGCDEIANDGNPKLPRWNKAKREHKRFVNALLQSDMDIVACIRAREKSKPGKDENGNFTYISQGVQPVCEKNFMFEMTASLLMHDEGKRYDRLKMPAELQAAFPGNGYITAATGEAVRQWVQGAAAKRPEDRLRDRLMSVAENGVAAVNAEWLKVSAEGRKKIGDSILNEALAAALEFERMRTEAQPDEPEVVAGINAKVSSGDSHGMPVEFDFKG